MVGYADPFNRRPFPWGHEEEDFQEHFRNLGRLKQGLSASEQCHLYFHTGSARLVA